MVAITVLVVAMLGSMVSQLASMNLMRTSHETNAAIMDLKGVMDQILIYNPTIVPIAGGVYPSGVAVAAYNGLHLRDERIVPTYPGYAGGLVVPNPMQIVVTATWTDYAGRPRSLSLASMKTQ